MHNNEKKIRQLSNHYRAWVCILIRKKNSCKSDFSVKSGKKF